MQLTTISKFESLVFTQIYISKFENKEISYKSLKLVITRILLLFFLILLSENFELPVLAQNNEKIIAVVNGKNINLTDIESLIPTQYLISNPEQLYAVRQVVLDNYITKILLQDEADRRKISVEDLRKIMAFGNIEVSNEKVEKEYLNNAPYFALMSPDEAKERIRLDLENEAKIQLYRKALSKLKKTAKIEIYLKEFPLSAGKTNKKPHPSKGVESAKVIIIEYADFRCPYCKESQTVLKQLLDDYKDDIKLIYKYLPLQTDLQSLMPAIATYCAGEQDRFWELHDNLFSSNDLSLVSIKQMANEINLDNSKFESCLTSENSRFAVLSDLKEATQLGITATPTFIINGKIFLGKRSLTEFSKIIENELEIIRKKQNN